MRAIVAIVECIYSDNSLKMAIDWKEIGNMLLNVSLSVELA